MVPRRLHGDEPVGFVMISDGITVVNPEYLGPYFLWRLLIDQRYQGRGYGAAAIVWWSNMCGRGRTLACS